MADVEPPILLHHSLYGYTPTESVCAIFIALFGLSTLIHIGEVFVYKTWWLIPTAVLAGVGEIIGWIGRLWSSQSPQLLNPYLMQICTTIISPTPLIAANFVILGMLISHLGTQYSRLSPGWYTIVFCTADIVALIVQAVGGASASEAVENNHNPAPGGHIMLGGIVFQMAAITIYVILAFEFLYRASKNRPLRGKGQPALEPSEKDTPRLDRNIKLMIAGLSLSTVCVFIRAVYRTIELSNGWTGRIIHTQVYFNVLDGAMIVIAIFTLNILHPGYLLAHINLPKKKLSRTPSNGSADGAKGVQGV